ncbi:hypothetical protein GY45DRAFT_1355271 [Cubamyces sp. BRFM 1775]|nr:hypothetical protein GY45DRAFT_1355271 [Cubamyces sp. BRFM 1775]
MRRLAFRLRCYDTVRVAKGSNLRRCAGCAKARYCSKECQTAGWRIHIFDSYYLSKACHEGVVPLHEQTRADYGFDKALELAGGLGERMLLGLWTEVFKEVQKWQSEGRLVEGIKNTYQQVRPSHLLDGRPLSEAEKEGSVESYSDTLHRTWEFIGGPPSDLRHTIWPQIGARPSYEQRCFFFYESLVGNRDLTPENAETWLSFGFTAMTREGVGELVEKYKQLMSPQLFSAHGIAAPTATLSSQDGPFPLTLFLDVMSQSPHFYKSVWLLKLHVDRLLRVATSGSPKVPHGVVEVDYGYSNCKTSGEKRLLDALYKKYFVHPNANPLDLHDACNKGELGQYLAQFVRMKPKTKTYMRLLKTAYPNSGLGDKAGVAGNGDEK